MIRDTVDAIKRLFAKRSFAYHQVFDRKSVHVNEVLKDLAKFCRAHETTFDADPRRHAVMEGRREVWLRIAEYLNLHPDEIYELHKIKDIPKEVKK